MIKHTFSLKDFRPDGFHFNILYALYIVTLAPLISDFINFDHTNVFIALLGIFIYLTEYFAFNYKLRIVRARAIQKNMLHQQKTGEKRELGQPGCMVFYAFIIRMLYRIGFVIVALTAFGADFNEEMSGYVSVIFVSVILFEVFVFCYSLFETRIYSSPPADKTEEEDEKQEEKSWREKYLPLLKKTDSSQREMGADLILFLYACMLTTAYFEPVNAAQNEVIFRWHNEGTSALAMIAGLLLMFSATWLFALMPMRLAYWVEESLASYTVKEKWRLIGSYAFACLAAVAPSVLYFIKIYFL